MRQAIKRALSATCAFGAIAGMLVSAPAPAADGLKIGVLGGMSVQDGFASQKCMMQDLADSLGVPVTVNAFASSAELQDALIAGAVDVASLSARGYSALWRSNARAVQPVLAPIEGGGAKGFRAVAVARTDADISTLEALKGKEIGFVDDRSLPGYFVPAAALERAGLKVENDLGAVQFSGGHHANLTALESGAIDAAVSWMIEKNETIAGPLARFEQTSGSSFVEVWRSSLMPNGPIVLRKALSETAKVRIAERIARLGEKDPDCLAASFGRPITGLFPVSHADYETFIQADQKRISLSVASN